MDKQIDHIYCYFSVGSLSKNVTLKIKQTKVYELNKYMEIKTQQ